MNIIRHPLNDNVLTICARTKETNQNEKKNVPIRMTIEADRQRFSPDDDDDSDDD